MSSGDHPRWAVLGRWSAATATAVMPPAVLVAGLGLLWAVTLRGLGRRGIPLAAGLTFVAIAAHVTLYGAP
jgi:hypothetical protein